MGTKPWKEIKDNIYRKRRTPRRDKLVREFEVFKAGLVFFFLIIASHLSGQTSYEIGYKGDPGISDFQGNPINRESLYFPIINSSYSRHYIETDSIVRWIDDKHLDLFINEFGEKRINESMAYHSIDPYYQRIYSKYLFEFNEPILYNYFLGRDIVRFTYLRAFDHPIVIKLEHYNDSTFFTLKIIDYQINDTLLGHAFRSDFSIISSCNNSVEWIVNKETLMDNSVFTALQTLIKDLKIAGEVPFYGVIGGLDGSDWIIELHSEKGYYYNKRWSPPENSSNRIIAEFLIRLSELTDFIY